MKRLVLMFAAVMATHSVAVSAHHAFAQEFSVELPVKLRGTVTKVELINPHSWIHIAVTNDAGVVEDWMVEGGSPNSLFRQGVTKNSIPIGSELDVSGYQARDKSNKMVGRDISFSDGRPLFFRGTPVPDGQ